MSEDQIPKKIYDVLKKLMNLKEGAEKIGSIHEAENAAARINEILLKYNLELSEIKFSEKSKIEYDETALPGIVFEDGIFKNKRKNEGNWVQLLYMIISKHNLCKVVFSTRKNFIFGVMIFGKRVNIEIVKYLIGYLEVVLLELAKTSWNTHSLSNTSDTKNTYIRSFLQGAVMGINKKLTDEKNRMMAESNIMTSLIKREDIEIDAVINAQLKDQKEKKMQTSSSNNGLKHGFEAGKAIQLNKGLHTNSQNSKMIN